MYSIQKEGIFLMNTNPDKVLLPNDVRKLLNIDNREIVELCKKTSVNPKKDSSGRIYFSVDEVKKLILALGKSDIESQTRMIDLCIENLKGITDETKEDINKKGAVYKKLSTIIGLAIGIILI